MKIISFSCFVVLVSLPGVLHAQAASPVRWETNLFDEKVFIENKGQLPSDILFTASSNGVDIYFSSRGITYKHDDVTRVDEAGARKKKDENEKTLKVTPHVLRMDWAGADPDAKIISEDAVSYYFTYAADKATLKARACKKIIYKNIYPKIDVEYVFPKDSAGIKYSFILHPGADPALIKMKYSDAENIFLNEKGNVEIKSTFGDFMDHAPKTFYESGESISSGFQLEGNTVSFKLTFDPNGYRDSLLESTIIDPWLISPAFTTDNKAFDIAKDAAGNIYTYGGGGTSSPWKLKKFDPSGNPMWTYNTTYISSNNEYYGDLAVDLAGNSYITEGYGGGGIQKINTGGTATWNVSKGPYEFWCLAFNCSFTKLYLGCGYAGGPATPTNSIANVDLNTGAISGGTVLNSGGGAAEPRAIAWGPNGNIYFISCSPGDRVYGVTPAFTNIFSVPSGYTMTYLGPSYTNGAQLCSGQNGIAANNKYIYTSDGLVLNRRNVQNGAFLSTINIPGGVAGANSGIVVDDCGNVYAGSSNGVYKYDSLLTFISSAPTTGAVYCLYAGSGGEVLASGNGFIASLGLSYCTSNLNLNPASTNVNCTGPNSGTASVAPSGGSAPYTYSWDAGQTTQTITGLAAGSYSVMVADASGCKQSSATFTITAVSTLSITTTTVPAGCGNNGSATANPTGGSAPYTYNWSPAAGTDMTATGLSAGNYTVSVTDAGGCSGTNTFSIASSGSITATATGSTICAGQNATLTATGGTTYSWNNGATTSSISVAPTGTSTYSVMVSSGSCSVTTTATVTVNPLPVISVSGNNTICAGVTATLTGSGGGTYSWSSGSTVNPVLVSPTSSTTYSVTVSTGNCSSTATASVTVNPSPVASTSGDVTISAGDNTTLSASGGGNYSWNNGAGNNPIITVSPTGTTIYCVTVTNTNNCTDSACVTVTVIAEPTDCSNTGELYLPNAFSPNGDNENDNLQVYFGNFSCIRSLHINIYDRWGEKIFQSSDAGFKWDGSYKNKKLGNGVYTYYLQATLINGKEISKKGNISLLR